MSKIERKGGTLLAPVPVVMVSSSAAGFRKNIITIAWCGTLCSDPPLLGISIRPGRYSYEIIKESKEFVVNLPDRKLLKAMDFCGVVSGREVDKFAETGLTAQSGKMIKAPLILEAPVNLECQVKEVITLGTHDLFLGEVVWAHFNQSVLDEKGLLDLNQLEGVAYGNGNYYRIGELLGKYGYSGLKGK